MRPLTIGRVLGIGLRVAGRVAGKAIAGEPHRPQPRPVGAAALSGAAPSTRSRGRAAAQTTVRAGKATVRGVGGFLGAFKRVGGILWLEVTGVFFLLFAAVFAWYMTQNWPTHSHSGSYRTVALCGAFLLLFLYLGLSSFWRASRR